MEGKRTLSVVYLEGWGFPYGMAAIQKMRLVSKSLLRAGARVTVISNRAVHRRGTIPDFSPNGNFEGIEYVHTTGAVYRPASFVGRNTLKIRGVINELLLLFRLARQRRVDAAILGSLSFWRVLYYSCVAHAFGFPLVYEYVEFLSSHTTRQSLMRRVNDRLIDRYVFRLVAGVLPISRFLSDHVTRIAPRLPQLQIPVLVDVQRFAAYRNEPGPAYFLFCGSLGYLEVMLFILNAYDQTAPGSNPWHLRLIVNGSRALRRTLEERIRQSPRTPFIQVTSDLSEEELTRSYVNASALLIPMRPNLQDEARFPHKIGEYLSTGNPVITTGFGEVKAFLVDGLNALVAREYDPLAYSEKLAWVMAHPQEARAIGERGRMLALETFDYSIYADRLRTFLSGLAPNGQLRTRIVPEEAR